MSLTDNLKVCLWKRTVSQSNYSGTNSKNIWGMPLRPATLFKKETLAQVFSCEFCKKISRTSILKNICKWLLLVAGWRTTQKLCHKDLLLLSCLAFINISVTGSLSFINLRFLYRFLFWFWRSLIYKGKIIWRTSAGSKI